jgi:hypothetical protein
MEEVVKPMLDSGDADCQDATWGHEKHVALILHQQYITFILNCKTL